MNPVDLMVSQFVRKPIVTVLPMDAFFASILLHCKLSFHRPVKAGTVFGQTATAQIIPRSIEVKDLCSFMKTIPMGHGLPQILLHRGTRLR
jgi:hypothetical protein